MESVRLASCIPHWLALPHETMAKIFGYLAAAELLSCRSVCWSWFCQTKDIALWRTLLLRDFGVARETLEDCPDVEGEYRRLYSETPCIAVQTLKQHTDEVLHVSIAPSGCLAATCSKDNLVITWLIAKPGVTVTKSTRLEKLKEFNCAEFGWRYPQWSCFSPDSRFLLVTGVVSEHGNGEVGVFNSRTLEELVRARNFPFDFYSAWLTPIHVLDALERFYGEYELEEESFCTIYCTNVLTNDSTEICHFAGSQIAYVRSLLLSNCAVDMQGHVTGLPLCETLDGSQELSNRLLLYSMGCQTFAPHRIGCAIIEGRTIQSMLDATESGSRDGINNSMVPLCERHLNTVEMEGHVVGMALSPDCHQLFANVRKWVSPRPPNAKYWDSSPAIEEDMQLCVLSIPNFDCLHTFRGHESYTPSSSCFFIYCDVTERLAASGAEDKHVHIWDQAHHSRVAKLSGHTDVVSSVAFSPVQPQLLLSAADDHTLRVWVSRSLARCTHSESVHCSP